MTTAEPTRAECVVACGCTLGEGVIWDASAGLVRWTDIQGKALWSFDPITDISVRVDLADRLACFAPTRAGRLLAGFAGGLAWLDPVTGAHSELHPVEPDEPRTRINDGRVDRQGRLVFGTMDENSDREPRGKVWIADGADAPRLLFDGVHIANSIAFSPDGGEMYFTDTVGRTIFRYGYDTDSGAVHGRTVFVEIAGPGHPDGSCIDAEGCLWNARWGGGCVVRYRPDGSVTHTVDLPCGHVTCCAFGGADLSTLFITTAREGLDPAGLAGQPQAGHLFACRPGVAGLRDTPARG